MNIEKLHGTSTRLYQLVAPLVMSPAILRQNNNYPFKTTDHHVWFVASEGDKVCGFMPIEIKSTCICIDNYYVSGDNTALLSSFAQKAIDEFTGDKPIYVISHASHADTFRACGFTIKKEWKLYIKMMHEIHEKS